MIREEIQSIREGFGGELTGEDFEKFEKTRQTNAEVLGYTLTGKTDIKLEKSKINTKSSKITKIQE